MQKTSVQAVTLFAFKPGKRKPVHKIPIDLSETFQDDLLAGANRNTSPVVVAVSQWEPLLMLRESMV